MDRGLFKRKSIRIFLEDTVHTVALGWYHLKAYEDLGLSATYLGDESTKEKFEDFLSESLPVKNRPRVIILTPEKLFGNLIQNALSSFSSQLKFITIDEVHSVFEWIHTKNYFNSIKRLKSMFECPILTFSATLKPKDLAR
ncbi:hypothetical protein DAPPUDRAFT_332540 [Daphnia pulex]|uniref:Helicase ATP-binding domain-containing protein n=1 Tax=Daphnia pulex TaxID=6669 RepID=E9HQ91_DAPPU|nr:hypothetical protein DAPPUDRAFT_332540 [Daphnia pulex]|eukprot:EFX66082.1 hypothetical protein DAPPUDRAFT_332540 [Daphnia pulex]